jgi:amino-acid N-acetyltransferase
VSDVIIRPAAPADLGAAQDLLRAARLPVDGVADFWGDAYAVAVRGGELVGVAGIERYHDEGLLRSVAVHESLRGSGVGGKLVEDRLRWAEQQGIRALYLLTDTAARWFPRYGFVPVDRAEVPEPVRAAPEFSTICASTAAVLVRTSA